MNLLYSRLIIYWRMNMSLDDDQFRSLLDLWMHIEEWPEESETQPIEELLQEESRLRGFGSINAAFTKFHPSIT